MLQIEVDTSGTEADLRRLSSSIDSEMQKALKLAGRIVQAEAKKRCPVSPTKAQAKGTGYRFDHTKAPGTLRADIIVAEGSGYVDVGVMRGNGQKYANQIHNGSYKLGPGSEAAQSSNGERVGPKFIDRAYDDNEAKVRGVFDKRATVAVNKVA